MSDDEKNYTQRKIDLALKHLDALATEKEKLDYARSLNSDKELCRGTHSVED